MNIMDKQAQRPHLLSALCILTFIGSTTAFLSYFLASLFFEETSQLILKYSSWHSTEDISPLYFTLLMALHAFSLFGAIRMWKLHKNGLWIYVLAQLLIVFLPVIWIDWYALSTVNLIFTGVFVLGYAVNYGKMR